MMDCIHYRRTLMVDPHDPDQALGEHRATCHDCNLYTQRLLRFESRLERALGVPVPAQADSPTTARAELGTGAPESGHVIPFRRKSSRAAADSAPYRKGWLAMQPACSWPWSWREDFGSVPPVPASRPTS